MSRKPRVFKLMHPGPDGAALPTPVPAYAAVHRRPVSPEAPRLAPLDEVQCGQLTDQPGAHFPHKQVAEHPYKAHVAEQVDPACTPAPQQFTSATIL
jgi:hypothetical protein